MADFPFQVLYPSVFATLIYWLVGFKADLRTFLILLATVILQSQIASSIGLCLGVLVRDTTTALALAPITFTPLMIFSGFLINRDSTPVYFIWLQESSFMRYSFEILVVNEFRSLTFECPAALPCQYRTGVDIIKYLTFENSDERIARNFLVLLLWLFGIRLLGAIAMHWRAQKSRGV
jgi:ATP-binding cassette, subfamily G (WHITE), member 1